MGWERKKYIFVKNNTHPLGVENLIPLISGEVQVP